MISSELDPKFVTDPLEAIENQMRKHDYSHQTVKAYQGQLKSFFIRISPRLPHEATNEDLHEFINHLNETKKSRSTIDQAVNALRFLWKEVLSREFPIEDISRPVKKERQPVFLTLEEVQRIAMASENLKHRLMIEMAYSAGLRVSEVVNIKVQDVDLENKSLFVCGFGKNPKGRTTIFSGDLEDAIVRQIGMKKPSDLLFPSERGGRLTTRAFAKYFKAALESSGVKKAATPHSLRHSFAALLLQTGEKVRTVQNLLGHVRRESTNFYTKLVGSTQATRSAAQPV